MTLEPYDFRKPAALPQALRTSLTGWAGQVARLWAAQLPFPVEIVPQPVTFETAGSLVGDLPDGLIGFRSLRAGSSDTSILLIPRAVVISLLAGLLGDPLDGANLERDLTAIEEDAAELIAEQFFLEPLQQAWPFAAKLQLTPPRREARLSSVQSPDQAMLAVRFQVQGPFGKQAWLWALPRTGWMDSLVGPRANDAGQRQGKPGAQGEGKETLVRELPLKLTVTLGTLRLSLLHAGTLQVGDVLLLDQKIDQPLAALVGGQRKFLVWPGARGSRQAVSIHSPVES